MVFNNLENEVEDIIEKFGKNMDLIMLEVSELISDYILTNDMTKVNALAFDKAIQDMLSRAGYYEVVNEFIDNDYDKLFPMIQENLFISGVTTTYTTVDLANVMALKALDKNTFSILASTAGSSLRESLTKYAISNYTARDMQREILNEFEGTNIARHSKTIADTAISQFQQSVINMKAEEYPDSVWYYEGANIDSKTRDYCKCILNQNKYYSESDKRRMESDSRRKYNCRHKFYFGTVEYVEGLGMTKSNKVTCR